MPELVALDVKFDPFDIEGAVITHLLESMSYRWLSGAVPPPNVRGQHMSQPRARQHGIRASLLGLVEIARADPNGPPIEINGQKCRPYLIETGTFMHPTLYEVKFVLWANSVAYCRSCIGRCVCPMSRRPGSRRAWMASSG